MSIAVRFLTIENFIDLLKEKGTSAVEIETNNKDYKGCKFAQLKFEKITDYGKQIFVGTGFTAKDCIIVSGPPNVDSDAGKKYLSSTHPERRHIDISSLSCPKLAEFSKLLKQVLQDKIKELKKTKGQTFKTWPTKVNDTIRTHYSENCPLDDKAGTPYLNKDGIEDPRIGVNIDFDTYKPHEKMPKVYHNRPKTVIYAVKKNKFGKRVIELLTYPNSDGEEELVNEHNVHKRIGSGSKIIIGKFTVELTCSTKGVCLRINAHELTIDAKTPSVNEIEEPDETEHVNEYLRSLEIEDEKDNNSPKDEDINNSPKDENGKEEEDVEGIDL